jgi:hypothetical protein
MSGRHDCEVAMSNERNAPLAVVDDRLLASLTMTSNPEAAAPVLEFWPDYGPGPLWDAQGKAVEPRSLGLAADLLNRLLAFNAAYAEERVPIDGPGDADYLGEGTSLLAAVRAALKGRFQVVVTEPWWGEEP